jgi:hypothetical protein
MDLQALNNGPTPAQKGWLHPIVSNLLSSNITTDTLTANTVDFKTIETNSLTLVQQVSVPNPSVGAKTIYIASGTGLLTTQDSLGNSVPYLPSDGSGTMTGPLDFKTDIQITSNTVGASVEIGNTTSAALGSVAVGGGATATGNQQVALGPGAAAGTGAFSVIVGRNASAASSGADVVIGNSAAATAVAVGSSVVIGSTALSDSINAVVIGRNAHATNAGTQQVAIGFGAIATQSNNVAIGADANATGNNCVVLGALGVNAIDGSILLGNVGITLVYPANIACALGSPASPFRICYLRDSAPASSCRYSQYGPVTITNTAADTSYATGTALGSLVLSANQTPGTIIRFKGNFAYSEILADSSTFRVKVNGAPLVAMVVGPGLFVTQGLDIEGAIVVLGGGNAQCELRVLLESEPVGITNATSAWNEGLANTLDFSVQFSAADPGNTLVCNFLYVESLYTQ